MEFRAERNQGKEQEQKSTTQGQAVSGSEVSLWIAESVQSDFTQIL